MTRCYSYARLTAICAVIFFTSVGVRLLYLQDTYVYLAPGKNSSEHFPLTRFYYDQSRRMVSDGGVLFPSNAVDTGDVSIITHPPGYSILILTIFRMLYGANGDQDLAKTDSALCLLQIVCDALSTVVVFLIAAELFPLAIATIAGLLSSFSPHFAYYSILLSPDTLFVLPVLLAVYSLLRASKRPRLITTLVAGALIGLSCWLRPNALLLAPFLLIIIPPLFKPGNRLRHSLALVCGSLLVIAPIIIRNWIVFHRFIPISGTTGLLLVEGIGDYDKERRFGMPANDSEAAPKDVEWHGRPEYADSIWKPDGIERDRARLERGLAVIRSNPGWFLKVMLRRMEFMLRYNDFRKQELANVTIAPTISITPNYIHDPEVSEGVVPTRSLSPAELLAGGTFVSERTSAVLEEDGATLRICTDGADYGDLFFSEPITVKTNTDYLFRLAVNLDQGNIQIKIGTGDPRIVLALMSADTAKRKGPKIKDESKAEPGLTRSQTMKELLVPFASGDNTQVQLSLFKSTTEPTVLKLGAAALLESGPTRYMWTHYPRILIRGIQKNFFKTDVARGLIVIGIMFLALACRRKELAILLIVPVYFLLFQAPLHTEYRYILSMHYFLFVIAAVTIYAPLVFLISVGRCIYWKKVCGPVGSLTSSAARLSVLEQLRKVFECRD